MKVCIHRGLLIAVLTRNEHCPPHVHVGAVSWNARFEFSFWHDGVRLWDVKPAQNEPSAVILEGLRQVLKQPAHLRRARELWWISRRTLCLERYLWDLDAGEAVSPKAPRPGALRIESASFDPHAYKTLLQLSGQARPLEIEL